ncbi:hypothetical protein O3P69_014469 [Scylla paramamosain]|uniref:Variant Ionotropic Glutamate Receptor n=1 Tax=Scylla paramamosain TaxID=85552 RepID=A0AAW0TEH4_SCYPA
MVAVALLTWLFFLNTQSLRSAALLRQSSVHSRTRVSLFSIAIESTAPEALAAVQDVWASQRQHQCPALLLSDNPSQVALTFVKEAEEKLSPRGIVVFLVTPQHRQGNGTLVYLRAMVDKVRQMGGVWHCLLVVVVSDDPAFLSAFAHLSLRRHALRWSTRILVLTRLPLGHLDGLHGILSNRNAMLLLAHRGQKTRYRYVLSPDRTFGTKIPDGSWTGMMGMVVREEVHFAAGPFMLSPERAAAGDYTVAVWNGDVRIVSGLGGLQIDPWGFMLPFTPLVWEGALTALLGVTAVLQVLSSCLPGKALCFSPVRVLLQQDVVWPVEWWWWERLVLALWMLTTLVLTKSYAGNLMSLLATAESGVFREVAELEEKGRLKFLIQEQFQESLDTLVRAGHHVLIDIENAIKSLESGLLKYWAQDVPNFTRCNNVPKTVALSTTLSISNLWGVFVLLASGLTAGLVVWCLELLNSLAKKSS